MEIKSRKPSVSESRASDFLPQSAEAVAVLRERADHLATRIIDKAAIKNAVTYICFRIGQNDQYGIPYQYATAIASHVTYSKVPWTPAFIAGTVNRRGSLVTILDLKQLFYGQTASHDNDIYIIFVTANNMTVGIIADSIVGSIDYDPSTLDPPLATAKVIKPEYILGLHEGKTAVINIEAILSDPQLQIKI